MEIAKFLALLAGQCIILCFPLSLAMVSLPSMTLAIALWHRLLWTKFKKLLVIYFISLIFWIPLIVLEISFFQYQLANLWFLSGLYVKCLLSIWLFVIYQHYTTSHEMLFVLHKLHIPPVFLLSGVFILFFAKRLMRSVSNMQTAYSLRVVNADYFFRIKILVAMAKNLIIFSFHHLDDIHATIVLRKLNRPCPFDLLYQYEKDYLMRLKLKNPEQ